MVISSNSLPLIYDTEVLSIGKLKQPVELPAESQDLFSLTITSQEISLVAPAHFFAHIKSAVIELESNWQAIKIDQVLGFNMVGVIANISQILAAVDISIFVISTFNTDYILIKQERMNLALKTLAEHHFPISKLV